MTLEIRSPHGRRMRAAYVRSELCASVSCPYAPGAYACPVSAEHMRLLCWRLTHSGESVSLPDKTTHGR